jgi:hypothetical protein
VTGRTCVVAVAAVCVWLSACAPKQAVVFDACEAEKVTVYVDGRLLRPGTKPPELRSDLPHKLFFKREGHEPRLIILEPTADEAGKLRLEPADPCAEVLAVPLDRELTVEVDEGEQVTPVPDAPPGSLPPGAVTPATEEIPVP